MSFLNSKVPSLQLWVEPFPTKTPFEGKVVRVDRTYVGVDKNGEIYSSQVSKGFSYSLLSNLESTYAGLVKLKKISKADMDLHEEHRKKTNRERDENYQASRIEEIAKALGLRLTPKQKARIEEIKTRKLMQDLQS